MIHYDAIVIGAGPAGCGAARLLAACGHRVLLVDRPGAVRPAQAESIPPSARKSLAALGMLAAVDAAGFQPWLGNTVWWGDAAPRVESFGPAEVGVQVLRSRFDALLRTLAAEAGAEVRVARVRDVMLASRDAPDRVGTTSSVVLDVDGEPSRLTASFILDASGRAGVIARQGFRVPETSHRTVALVAVWHATTPWPVPDTHTLVASYADGWAWSVPTGPGVRYISVMVDPERTTLTRGASAADVYRAELAKVTPFAAVIEHAELVEGPWGADASVYAARQYAGADFLLVGDAATAIDPLSSFGVKKALASGWLSAIAVHTALTRPAMAEAALTFFDTRERAVWSSARAATARFAADASAATAHPFWRARTAATDDADPDSDADPTALAQDPSVLAALDDLRRRQDIHLRLGEEARVATRATVRGHEIVMDDHVFIPAWPEGERYLRLVDLVELVRLAPNHTDVGALYDAYDKRHPGTALPDFLGALSVLVAKGGLQHE